MASPVSWAEGRNVGDFWKNSNQLEDNPTRVEWMANQFLGIADGSMRIHWKTTSDQEVTDCDVGIHGNIKPENILHSKDASDANGKLAICAFGFTKFHSSKSRSNATPGGFPASYCAPEYDFKT